MKTWPLLVAGTVCLTVAGCRMDPRIAQLERANRLLEDRIYQLQWELEDCQSAARRDGAEDATWSLPLEPVPDADSPWDETPPHASPRQAPALKLEGSLEEVTPGEALDSLRGRRAVEPSGPVPGESPDGPQLPGAGGDGEDSSGWKTAPPKPAISSTGQQVTQIVLDRRAIRGYGTVEGTSDAGLLIVVEPRNATGRPLDVPGDVSVVVLDPALQGEAARVARWDFSAAETARMIRSSGPGIELTLPWPAGQPKHADLHLFVRYVTEDGRKLEVDAPIRIASAVLGASLHHDDESAMPAPRVARPVWSPTGSGSSSQSRDRWSRIVWQ